MIRLVIVEPEGPENLGMIARAMANMGCSQLALVNPRCDHLSLPSKKYSLHAFPLLEQAILYPDLKSALEGSRISVAITRRSGDKRRLDLYSPDLAPYLAPYSDSTVSLVFGREQTGLSNDEIFLCNLSCSIPSHDSFPSLNLAQAVMVILYELFQNTESTQSSLASEQEFEAMLSSIQHCLESMNYFKKTDPAGLMYVLQKIFHRARLDQKDSVVVKNLFERIEGHFHRR